jgi:hypothetical protein
MTDEEIKKMTGQAGNDRPAAYKLNEVKMSGDTGEFSIREILGEKEEDGKYPVKEMGKAVNAVILKMRWRLARYEELPGGKSTMWMTSEYENKTTDEVILFNNGERGIATDLKERHKLGSQRVLYVFLPGRKEVARLIVKPSALSGDKNPADEKGQAMGLFEYVDMFNEQKLNLHEFNTTFSSVYRTDPGGNKRKDYFAMTFAKGTEVAQENKGKVVEMIQEVVAKIGKGSPEIAAPAVSGTDTDNYPTDDINPDDIPF